MDGIEPPRTLGDRYRVLGAVGRGAIAEVFRARDERTGAEVALKVLYPHLGESAAVVERFRREVEIVRRIEHPHVLAIRDLVDAGGELFLVMDFHPGGDLADRLARDGRLADGELRSLAAQVGGALGAAHRTGVVHRDVKPSNVLCGAGPALDARLCDFGLARTADLAGLTTANAVLGTPEYMAPEVVADGHADPRSDIYSLGVLLFEAATGRLPFYGDSPYQLMRQHLDVEAPRARALAPALSPEIDAAIARALAKDPLDRFATVEDLVRALAGGAAGEARTALALAPAVSPAIARPACSDCGGWMVESAGVCADCGTRRLRVVWEKGGVSVLVTGPGKTADKLDAWRHAALYQLLDEIGPAARQPKRRRAPRLPFYVARGISGSSAEALVERLGRLGFETWIRGASEPAPAALSDRRWQMTKRYAAIFGTLGLTNFWLWRLPPGWTWPILSTVISYILTMFAKSTAQSVRPLLRAGKAHQRAPGAVSRIGEAMASLESRQDWRLCARLLDRLAALAASAHGTAAASAAERAARAAEGLCTLDEARRTTPGDAGAPERDLETLRRDEQTRGTLRAQLLRLASQLDTLSLAIARAGAASAPDALARIEEEASELALAVEAEQEVGALLGKAR